MNFLLKMMHYVWHFKVNASVMRYYFWTVVTCLARAFNDDCYRVTEIANAGFDSESIPSVMPHSLLVDSSRTKSS